MTRVDACASCGGDSKATETRANPRGQIRRARQCKACGEAWTTVECRIPAEARGPGRSTSVMVLPVASLGHVREAVDALLAMLKGGGA